MSASDDDIADIYLRAAERACATGDDGFLIEILDEVTADMPASERAEFQRRMSAKIDEILEREARRLVH